MPKKFWMVWVNDTPTTQRRYPTYELAKKEAERLAQQPKNVGKKVYILEAIDWCWINPDPVSWTNLDDWSRYSSPYSLKEQVK